MKKLSLISFVLALVLWGCGGMKVTVGNDTYSKESQAIVEKWIAAYRDRDAKVLLSLYSDDITWRDTTDGTAERLNELQGDIPLAFKRTGLKVEIRSYRVTEFGRFAILEAMYAEPEAGVKTPTPMTVILEFRGGKILNETWY